ncbi:MAG: hypothetical protein WB439_04920, partial [Acidobacteriaceae bacterium]
LRITAVQGERTMKTLAVSTLALAGLLSIGIAHAQTVGQDMKDAGHHTAHASKTVAHKTAHGTKVATHDTVHVSKKVGHKTAKVSKEGYHKTVHGTKHVVHKVEGKPANSPQ